MKFHVNTAVFCRVRIKRAAAMPDGAQAVLMDDHGDMEIWISDRVRPSRRIDRVRHEMSHAYDLTVGAVITEEGRAERHATIEAGITADLRKQGGLAALMCLPVEDDEPLTDEPRFVPEEAPASAEDGLPVIQLDENAVAVADDPIPDLETLERSAPRGGRVWCICQRSINESATLKGDVRFEFKYSGKVVTREAYCDGCGHKITWVEGVDYFEMPNGEVVEGPHFDRSPAAIRDFAKRLAERR